MTIKDLIKQERQQRGLSLRAFAAAFGVSYALVHEWEHGKQRPNLYQMKYYALTRQDWVGELAGKIAQVAEAES